MVQVEQVRDGGVLAAMGMEIADHTVRHVQLAGMSTAAAQDQIEFAAETIARLVGHRPTSFAYPFGPFDDAAVELVRQAGFTMAVTTRDCPYESSSTALLVPRLRVGPGTTPLDLVREPAA